MRKMPRKIKITAGPKNRFDLPDSDGYMLYSALLNKINESDNEISSHVHDTEFSSINVSNLDGKFSKPKTNRKHRKSVLPSEEYEFKIGVTDPKEAEIFQSLVEPLILNEGFIEFEDGSLRVEEFESSKVSFEEIFKEANEYEDPEILVQFETPTCIQFKDSKVTEMFPHRKAVFSSILSKWNGVVPNGFEIDISQEEIGRNIIEKPDNRSLEFHSVMVDRVDDENKGHKRPIFRQGFTGKCKYFFSKKTDQDFKMAVTALSLFSEFGGIGSSVSRGCGSVGIRIVNRS
ncbi:MAG: CRISPR-Cas system related protein Cas6, RAMP superfamily [Candidatus Methanohalarchaeum thermophilum]|uniref:CRISPR-Cas system related protein Cas6, RAMP superfamily n=1 Tax=Methanohalarchaeum thermophilum TaxID=1903181 RepID=A0A1Q6DWS8_METT1|nr:MAG: CRISPR-Cas system related protein Cas6, RAMP superfamily [Candidatus Methanohalarchaeum thermophilum]